MEFVVTLDTPTNYRTTGQQNYNNLSVNHTSATCLPQHLPTNYQIHSWKIQSLLTQIYLHTSMN